MSRIPQSMLWNDPSETSPTDGDDSESLAADSQPPDSAPWSSQPPASQLGTDPLDCGCSPIGPRNYFLPLHYEPNYRYPLVVWLHSDGFNENQVDHVMPHISVRNYVAAGVRGVRAADSIGHRFDWPQTGAAVAAADQTICDAIDEACQQFSIHPSRIVLAGYRGGGTMAIRIAMNNPDRYAGVVSLGGTMPDGKNLFSNLEELRRRKLPMLWLWGVEGDRFDQQQLIGDIRQAMMIKASVEVRQYPSEDVMDTVALSDVNEWIMRQVVCDRASQTDDRWATSPTAYSSN